MVAHKIECLLHSDVLEIRWWLDGWFSTIKRNEHAICSAKHRSWPSDLHYYI